MYDEKNILMYAKIKGILSDITPSTYATLMASGTGIGFDLLLSPLAYSLASQVGEGGECEMRSIIIAQR